ncbi:MAG TPA: HD domain-containing protein [Clostridia bacterium]|nr:HD domain-containing protein [Clostridia bacterium]
MGRMRLLSEAGGSTAEGFCLVKNVQVRTNIKGSIYLDFVLADCGGEVSAKLWDYDPALHGKEYEPEQVIKVRGSITLWKESEQLKIERIRLATEEDAVDMSLLVPCAPYSSEEMYAELFETTEAFKDDDLRRLTQYILKTNKALLLRAPAAVKMHHATRGGLLHHTLSVLKAAKALCPLYEGLDEELVFAGVILHDIAKLSEMDISELGLASGYTAKGRLIGHIGLGINMIGSVCELLDISDALCMLMQHMVLSHHSVAEYGSPKPPMFPEAELVAQLDMLDSRLYEMFDALEAVPQGGFSERVYALDDRHVFNHGRAKANLEEQ